MPSVVIRGAAAEVRWGYHTAATVTNWELSVDAAGADVTATVTSAHALRTSQPSLTFCVTRQKAPDLVWPVSSLHIADGRLSARLGPQE